MVGGLNPESQTTTSDFDRFKCKPPIDFITETFDPGLETPGPKSQKSWNIWGFCGVAGTLPGTRHRRLCIYPRTVCVVFKPTSSTYSCQNTLTGRRVVDNWTPELRKESPGGGKSCEKADTPGGVRLDIPVSKIVAHVTDRQQKNKTQQLFKQLSIITVVSVIGFGTNELFLVVFHSFALRPPRVPLESTPPPFPLEMNRTGVKCPFLPVRERKKVIIKIKWKKKARWM